MLALSLPQKVYPAFTLVVQSDAIMFGLGSGRAVYSLANTLNESNRRRGMQSILKRGLMKITLDGEYAFTEIGWALALAIREVKDKPGTYDLHTFLNSLNNEIVEAWLQLPMKHNPWWTHVFSDLGLTYIRSRTGKLDILLDMGSIVEWIETTPVPPNPDHLQEPKLGRAPDLGRFNAIKDACARRWGVVTAGNFDPGFDDMTRASRVFVEHPRAFTPPPPVVDAVDYDFLSDADIEEFEF